NGRYRLTRALHTGKQKDYDVRFTGALEVNADYVLHDTLNNTRRPATFRSDQALENEGHEFLAAGHPLIEESLAYFLKHPRRRCIVYAPEMDGRRSGACLIYVCRYLNGMTRAELITCHVSRSGKIEINLEDRLPDIPGSHAHQDRIRIEQRWEKNRLNDIVRNATEVVEQRAMQRAEELKENLHSIFKKEEYKLEISYGKKIRQLEEKRDRLQLKCRLEPTSTNRAQLTRIENDLLKSRQEREMRIYKVRREGRVNVELELLQMYLIGG
ncbi:MAG: hypothetical protein KDK30_09385, partial [Leptospiraceae bacterium]|nr:hypothetical protein [Leptospiraceae bacterium]